MEFGSADESTSTACLLIGADGIHSHVRRYTHSNVEPKYLGFVGMTSAIRFSRGNTDYSLPMTVMAKPRAFVIAPEDVDGSEVLIGTQDAFPERDKAGWRRLQSDKYEWSA